MGKHIIMSNKFMGIAILIGILIQNVGLLKYLNPMATLIYLIVGIYLLVLA